MIGREWLVHLVSGILICGMAVAAWFGERLNNERHTAQVRAATQERLNELRSRLENNLLSNIQLSQGLVSVIAANPRLTQEEFIRSAKPLFDGGSQLRNIGAAPNMVIRLMYPLVGNEKAIGLDFRRTPNQFETADLARRTGRLVLAGPLELAQGGSGIVARIPVFSDGDSGEKAFWGLISSVIDTQRLFADSGLLSDRLPIELAIRGKDAGGPPRERSFSGAPACSTRNLLRPSSPSPSVPGYWRRCRSAVGLSRRTMPGGCVESSCWWPSSSSVPSSRWEEPCGPLNTPGAGRTPAPPAWWPPWKTPLMSPCSGTTRVVA